MLGAVGLLLGEFHALHPSRGNGGLAKVEIVGIQELVEFHVSIVTFYNFRFWLKLADDFADSGEFFRRYFGCFVEKDGVAEFNLLDYEIFNVFILDVLHHEGVSAFEFALHPHCIHDCDDVVQAADSVLGVYPSEGRDAAYCLGNRFRLADSAGFYDDVFEFLHCHDFGNLFNQVGFERAADASVLKRNEALVLLADHSAFGNQVCVNVYFAYVVDNHGETYSFPIVENPVQQGSLAASKIARQQQNRYFFFHHAPLFQNFAQTYTKVLTFGSLIRKYAIIPGFVDGIMKYICRIASSGQDR